MFVFSRTVQQGLKKNANAEVSCESYWRHIPTMTTSASCTFPWCVHRPAPSNYCELRAASPPGGAVPPLPPDEKLEPHPVRCWHHYPCETMVPLPPVECWYPPRIRFWYPPPPVRCWWSNSHCRMKYGYGLACSAVCTRAGPFETCTGGTSFLPLLTRVSTSVKLAFFAMSQSSITFGSLNSTLSVSVLQKQYSICQKSVERIDKTQTKLNRKSKTHVYLVLDHILQVPEVLLEVFVFLLQFVVDRFLLFLPVNRVVRGHLSINGWTK